VRLAHSSHGAGNAPPSLGLEEGLFASVGIDLAMVEMSNTSDAIEAVVGGRAEFAIAAGGPILVAAAGGGDPLILLSIEGQNIFTVVGGRGVGVADLRGQTLAVTGPHDQDTLIMRRALRDWGLDPATDVTLTRVADRGAAWDAVVSGRVAAMAATAPQPVLARSLGLPVLRDFGARPEPYQLGSVATSRAFTAREPDLVRAFVSAFVASIRLFCSDVERALPHLAARSKLQDADVLRETHRVFANQLADVVPSVVALAAVAADIEALTSIRLAPDISRLVDASYVSGGRDAGSHRTEAAPHDRSPPGGEAPR
jgi:ABC-type nitrate/sulfonate/bicarbonate transport system substrate-binding protein